MNAESWTLALTQKTTNPLAVFTKDGVAKIIEMLEKEVQDNVYDVSTDKGRKEIASLAHKVSRSKVALDNLGKTLVADWKSKAKLVDSERKLIRDALDALRDRVREPLAEWEAAEKERLEKEELDKEISASHEQALEIDDLFDRKKEIEIKEQEQRLAEEKRLAKERVETEAKKQAEREARLQRESAEKARLQAEEKAKREKEEAEQRIISARVAEETAKREKEEAIKNAEDRRIRELNEQKNLLIKKQQQKEQEALRKKTEEDAKKERKAANIWHRKKVNNGILLKLIELGISEDHGKELIVKIAKNEIENLIITY